MEIMTDKEKAKRYDEAIKKAYWSWMYDSS